MEENERRSIFRSLMVPKFIPSRPKEDSDDSSMCGSSPLPIFWTNPHEVLGSCIMFLTLLITLGSNSESKSQIDAHLRRRQQVRRAQMYDCSPELRK